MSLRFLSLFSGCGGMDLGFQEAGFECVLAVDSDTTAIETHARNIKVPVLVADLSDPSLVFGVEGTVDVVTAGPPCQGFSLAGRRDLNDPRNSLVLDAVAICQRLSARAFVLENVDGIRLGEHAHFLDSVHRQFSAAGYSSRDFSISAQDVGLPQSRRRTVVVAVKGQDVLPDLSLPPASPTSMQDVLDIERGAFNHEPRVLEAGSEAHGIARHIAMGQKLCNVRGGSRSVHTWDVPEVFGDVTPRDRQVLLSLMRLRRQKRKRPTGDADPVAFDDLEAASPGLLRRHVSSLVSRGYIRMVGEDFDLTHTYNGKFRRLDWARPSPTVDTRFGQPRHFLHPTEQRGLSVREAARIQGFPDSFVFEGSLSQQFRQVGNAVPPPLGRAVAQYLLEVLS